MPLSLEQKLISRIYGHGRGWAFSVGQHLDYHYF